MKENLWGLTDNVILDNYNRITFDLSQDSEENLVE